MLLTQSEILRTETYSLLEKLEVLYVPKSSWRPGLVRPFDSHTRRLKRGTVVFLYLFNRKRKRSGPEMEITKTIHRLGYRFPMVFFLEITNIWQKSQDFWLADFFLEIFKIHRLLWLFVINFFGCFECVSSMFWFKGSG
jgi:hypothetical protein